MGWGDFTTSGHLIKSNNINLYRKRRLKLYLGASTDVCECPPLAGRRLLFSTTMSWVTFFFLKERFVFLGVIDSVCLLTVSGDKRAINWRIGAACFHMAHLQCLKLVAKNIEKEEGRRFWGNSAFVHDATGCKGFPYFQSFYLLFESYLYSLPSTSYIAPVFL